MLFLTSHRSESFRGMELIFVIGPNGLMKLPQNFFKWIACREPCFLDTRKTGFWPKTHFSLFIAVKRPSGNLTLWVSDINFV